MDPRPDFLNVDLNIESTFPLRSLEKEFGKRACVLFSERLNGRHCLRVEIAALHKSLEGTLGALCALIEGLSPEGRRLWDAAGRREFDIGLEARFSSHRANRFSIRPSTLRRIGNLRANVAVTFYREDMAEPAPARPR